MVFVLALNGCFPEGQGRSQAAPENLAKTSRPKVYTPDWGWGAAMTAMGFSPLAMGDLRTYPQWMSEPVQPPEVIDVGIRFAPNPELLAQLEPDLVIDSDFYAHLRPMYGQTPVRQINVTPKNGVATWGDYAEATLTLGRMIHEPQATQDYLNRVQQQIKEAGQHFSASHPSIKKIAVVQFADTNNLRLYARNSLYEPTLYTMNLSLEALDAQLGQPNAWGFKSIKLGDLAKLDAQTCLVVVSPFNLMLHNELKENLVWRRMGFGQTRCMTIVPAVWPYGGASTMLTFSKALTRSTYAGLPKLNPAQ